jgi:translocation and assembly module TamB
MSEDINNGELSPEEENIKENEEKAPQTEDLDDQPPSHWGRTVWVWVSTILALSVGTGLTFGWFYVQRKLAPQVETSLTTALARPIKLGQVDKFTITGLTFGATEVPSTAKDPDKVTIEKIKVEFDPLLLITNRNLKLDVTLIRPKIYIEQDEKKQWIATKIIKKPGPIKVNLQRVKIENGEVILAPRGKDGKLEKQVPLLLKSANMALANENQQLLLNLNGGFSTQDEFKITAKTNLINKEYQISLNTKNTDIPILTRLISLPTKIQTGKLNSSLEIEGKETKISAVTGIAQIQSLNTIIPTLSQPLTETNLELKFRGKEARIVRFTTLFGQIPLIASGMLDLEKGWNVTAATDFTFKDLFNTLKVKKLPANLTGGLNVIAQITGPVDQPVIKADIKNNQPLKIDKVNVKEVKSKVTITTEKINLNDITISPILGGLIRGKGQINLTGKKEVKIDLTAGQIPAGAIALLYQPKLTIPMGLFNGKGKITGTLDKWQDLALTGQGSVKIANGTVLLNNLKVSKGKWETEIEAKGLQAEKLLTKVEQRIPKGLINGKFKLGGDLKDLGIKGITLNGTGNLTTNSGTIDLSNLSLNNGEVIANLSAVNVKVDSILSLSRPLGYQEAINGQFNLRTTVDNPQNIGFNGIVNIAGGSVSIEGKLADQELTGTIYTANLKTNNVSPKLPDALLTSNFNFTGSLNNLNIQGLSGNGQGNLKVAGGTILIDGIVKSGEFIGTVNTTGVQLNKLLPKIPAGVFNSKFKLQSNLSNLTPEKLSAKADGEIELGGGIVTVNGNVQEGKLVANVATNQVQVNSILPKLPAGKLNSQVNVHTPIIDLNLTDLNLQGKASLASLGGQIEVNNLSLNDGKWQGNLVASGVELAKIPEIPNQITKLGGKIGGDFLLAGDINKLHLNGILATGEGKINIAGGKISAQNVELNQGKFKAIITSEGLQLARIKPELQGDLNAEVAVAGDVNNLKPTTIFANGNVNLTKGVAIIPEAITASFNWDGKTLTTKTDAGKTLQLEGFANLNLEKKGLKAIENVNFEVAANNIDLEKLPLPIPQKVEEIVSKNQEEIVTGNVSFAGKIAGNIEKPELEGQVSLANFTLPAVQFEKQLNGAVSMSPENEIKVDLTGVNDTIQLSLASNYQPESFFFKVKEMEVRGKSEQDILTVVTNDIPLEFVKKAALIYSFPLNPTLLQNPEDFRGNVSGKLAVNWPSLTAKKSLPLFKAEANITGLNVQQLLTALEIFEFSDLRRGFSKPSYVRANSLYPTDNYSAPLFSINSEKTVDNQLNRLSEIAAFLQREERKRQENSTIPPLGDLEGNLNLALAASNSPELGLLAQLNLDGGSAADPWRWGGYTAQKVALSSTFKDGVLSVNPLRVELNDSVIQVSSQMGENPTAEVQLTNISLDLIDKFVKIPPFVDFGGGINATVQLADFPAKLRAIGAVNIKDATINETPIQSANGSFTYQDSRLDFLMSGLLSEEGDPLTVTGTFPLQLPGGQKPDNEELLLNISVKDQGIALVNLLTREQVNWIDGQGDIQLEVTGKFNQGAGKFSQLRAEGEANVDNATLTALALPEEPLTNVKGKILFDFDQIKVEELTGKLRRGDFLASGNLPLYRPMEEEKPLSITLDQLDIRLKSLYEGGVKGNILVTGTALEPKISGNLDLFNGQVFLPEPQVSGLTNLSNTNSFKFIYNKLKLNLTNNIQITKQPLLNFLGKGELFLTGNQRQPIFNGEIDLLRGQVNLFTTQFLLQGGHDNKAWFVPNNGLDPYLNVLLKTSAPETIRKATATDPLSAEIADVPKTDVGELQTVRIEAKVNGPASKLTENIELTSSPSRSESEIVGLLGGRFIDSIENVDTTLGLANLAGSALLGNIQNIIGNALGLSEFRLFPTNVNEEFTTDSGTKTSSNFGLGAEVGVDIGRQFSFSLLKVVNTPQPFQYGIRYRLNDEILFRGSTDLSGDSKATVQYNLRF